MRILVTGVTGQIGAALVPRLQGAHELIAADRAMLDLARPEAIPAALARFAPDVIVNPAAYTAVDQAEEERALAMRVNGEAPGVLARWAATRGVPLIHFSTDYVFDGEGTRAWREEDEAHPLSAYGASKLAGENEVRAAGGACLVVRTSWVYAANGRNFLRTIARLAGEREELRIVDDQIGAPTSAALIAETIARMLAGGSEDLRARSEKARSIVHLAAGGEVSWHGFASAIVDGLKARGTRLAVTRIVPTGTDQYPTRARRPLNSRLDTARLRAVFGITMPPWQSALAAELDRLAAELATADGRG